MISSSRFIVRHTRVEIVYGHRCLACSLFTSLSTRKARHRCVLIETRPTLGLTKIGWKSKLRGTAYGLKDTLKEHVISTTGVSTEVVQLGQKPIIEQTEYSFQGCLVPASLKASLGRFNSKIAHYRKHSSCKTRSRASRAPPDGANN